MPLVHERRPIHLMCHRHICIGGKLPKRLAKDKLTEEEAIAIQLELEDEQLQEWKEKVAAIRKKEEGKKSK